MVKILFVCYSMGTGGESLALAISKLDTCETLSHVKYSNGRTSTIDIFGSLFRGPGSKTGKYKFTKQEIDDCLQNATTNKWHVVASHFSYDAFKDVEAQKIFVVIQNPVTSQAQEIVYNNIRQKVLDQKYRSIIELAGAIKNYWPEVDPKQVLKGYNHQPTEAEIICKLDSSYDINTIYDVYPAEQMLPQYVGKQFPNAIFVPYEDTLDPAFTNNFTKKIHQLTK